MTQQDRKGQSPPKITSFQIPSAEAEELKAVFSLQDLTENLSLKPVYPVNELPG